MNKWVSGVLPILVVALLFLFQNCGKSFVSSDGDLATSASTNNPDNSGNTPNPPGVNLPPQVPVDPNAALSVYVRNSIVSAGANFSFKIELNKVATVPVVVTLKDTADSALPAVDYEILPAATVTIPAGQLSVNVDLKTYIFSPSLINKQMKLTATQVSAGQIVQADGVGVIKASYVLPKFKKIVTGNFTVCAITLDDALRCWGKNLRNGFPKEFFLPTDPLGLVGVKDVALGANHGCVITAVNSVRCWGTSLAAGLVIPDTVVGLTNVKQISISGASNCAIDGDDTVKCWGSNGNGQLGNNSNVDSNVPVPVLGLAGVKQISIGGLGGCAILGDDSVSCWGYGDILPATAGLGSLVPLPVGVAGVKQLAVGYYHVCALTLQNTVKCWGNSTWGALGLPVSPAVIGPPTDVPDLTGIKQISSGIAQTCAIKADDTLACWGNAGFALTYPTPLTGSRVPVNQVGMAGVKQVSSGRTFCTLHLDNTVKCAGDNTWSQRGPNLLVSSSIPTDAVGIGSFKDYSRNGEHSCFVLLDGTVKCYGSNYQRQLGTGLPMTVNSNLPNLVVGVAGIKTVASGPMHTCAITATDTVQCWGYNSNGQTGDTANAVLGSVFSVPFAVPGVAAVQKLSLGGAHTCALTAQGTVVCWGSNFFGQTGATATVTVAPPAEVPGLVGIKQIALGFAHTCAITATDTVKCWGSNSEEQLGANAGVSSPVPVDVIGLTGVKQITSGYNSNCALLAAGNVKCWGRNLEGQLGNGNQISSFTPVDAVGLTGIKSFSLGAYHGCAVTAADTLKCWGHNGFGQLGVSLNFSLVPVDVPGLSNVKRAMSALNSTAVELLDGRIRIFGLKEIVSSFNYYSVSDLAAAAP